MIWARLLQFCSYRVEMIGSYLAPKLYVEGSIPFARSK